MCKGNTAIKHLRSCRSATIPTPITFRTLHPHFTLPLLRLNYFPTTHALPFISIRLHHRLAPQPAQLSQRSFRSSCTTTTASQPPQLSQPSRTSCPLPYSTYHGLFGFLYLTRFPFTFIRFPFASAPLL